MITIVRGLPGSGKSTIAKRMKQCHVEADMFFIKDGVYEYKPELIKDAHEWCKAMTKYYLNQGEHVVVSNTFIKKWEIEEYIKIARKYGVKVKIIEAKGNYDSIHGIPKSKIGVMQQNWETIDNQFLN